MTDYDAKSDAWWEDLWASNGTRPPEYVKASLSKLLSTVAAEARAEGVKEERERVVGEIRSASISYERGLADGRSEAYRKGAVDERNACAAIADRYVSLGTRAMQIAREIRERGEHTKGTP